MTIFLLTLVIFAIMGILTLELAHALLASFVETVKGWISDRR